MQLDWPKYENAAKMILEDTDFGVVLVSEADNGFTGFMMLTYEWSDWRDGVFMWIQGAEGCPETLQALKKQLETFAETMQYKLCGVRLCNALKSEAENEGVKKLFNLGSSHYYIYHVDTC